MKREIVFPGQFFAPLKDHLFRQGETEQLAFVLCGYNETSRRLGLLAREVIPVRVENLSVQTRAFLSVKDEFSRSILGRCREEGLNLIEVHSHPFCRKGVRFSAIDFGNDREKFPYVARKIRGIYHATMVFGRESVDAHMWDREKEAIVPIDQVKVIGSHLRFLIPTSSRRGGWRSAIRKIIACRLTRRGHDHWLDRQVRGLGQAGQKLVQELNVGVVGCGGMGSVVSELLVRSGVRYLTLIDPDRVEASNLNRLLGAYRWDAMLNRPKVCVVKRQAQWINPLARVALLRSSVCTEKAVSLLKEMDVIFGCTDSQGSRLLLNRLATQYYIPYIDCGSGLVRNAKQRRIVEAGGQIRVVLPGGYCLECVGGIDREQARDELMTEAQRAQRRAHGYGLGPEEPAPQVMFLNMAVAAHAVGEFLKLVTGLGPCHSYVLYDSLGATMTPLKASKSNSCVVCGEESAAGLGDKEPVWEARVEETPREAPQVTSPMTQQLIGGK